MSSFVRKRHMYSLLSGILCMNYSVQVCFIVQCAAYLLKKYVMIDNLMFITDSYQSFTFSSALTRHYFQTLAPSCTATVRRTIDSTSQTSTHMVLHTYSSMQLFSRSKTVDFCLLRVPTWPFSVVNQSDLVFRQASLQKDRRFPHIAYNYFDVQGTSCYHF